MPDSEPATPFIPPRPDIGTPLGNSPAVLPSVIPMSPSNSQSSTSPPFANAFYSPYTGTPFIPPPMAPPGSYYMPTVQLPDNGQHPSMPPPTHPPGPQHHPPGVSADWIGPPTGQQQTGYATPYNAPAGMVPSPWSAAMSTPFAAFGAYAPALPPTNPPAAQGHFGPPMGPPPGANGYQFPYNTPAPQFAVPHGYPMGAYQTPAWPAAPMGFGAPPGPPPPAAPPPRQPERLTRAERYDKIGHFSAGPHYGPVLEPMLVKAVGAKLQMNPLLLPLGDEDIHPYLQWNMLFSTAHCHRSTDPSHRSWSNGRQEPATFPRVTELRLVSQSFPSIIHIRATNKTIGITCGDLIEQLSDHLQRRLRKEDYEGAPGSRRRAIRDAYHHNRSRSTGVPGGQLGDGLKALDWLGMQTMFGGIQQNEQLLLERFNVVMPCVLELICVERPLVVDNEDDRSQTRRRSRPMSTSRPPSRVDDYSSSSSS